ncbi:Hypothetical predicted protein [Olea europaea subsp. europaea]|uniref:Protein kinase domain-containing protein n=1 Tax=Olea europaea subsp. europaea TaxID=158383 RepID=A0A8S0S7G4_OLEEU|nr:Hypothetical predicted protein [Olea europaea subsp. europaea]
MGVIHQDLKLENFLVSDKVQASAHEGRLNTWMRRMGKRLEYVKNMGSGRRWSGGEFCGRGGGAELRGVQCGHPPRGVQCRLMPALDFEFDTGKSSVPTLDQEEEEEEKGRKKKKREGRRRVCPLFAITLTHVS